MEQKLEGMEAELAVLQKDVQRHEERQEKEEQVIVVVVVVVVFTLYTIPVSLPSIYLFLSQPLRTNPTLDSADFRGHRLTYLEKVYRCTVHKR